MARGYSQSRSEFSASEYVREAFAPRERYVKSSYIEPNADFIRQQKRLEKEGGLNDRAKELVEKFGSGFVTSDKNAYYKDDEPGSIRGNFKYSISGYGNPEGFGEKSAWTFAKTNITADKGKESVPNQQVDIAWREYNGRIYWSQISEKDGLKSYDKVYGGFSKLELVENGGRFKDIKEAIEWTLITELISDLEYNRGFQSYIESGGSLD